MSGTTIPKRLKRGTQMRDYKAVVRRKELDPSLPTSTAIRLAAKSRGKSPGAVQQSYYKITKVLGEQGVALQPVKEPPSNGNGKGTKKAAKKAVASVIAKQSLAGAMRAIESLEKENASLLKKCEELKEQNNALRARLAAIKAAL